MASSEDKNFKRSLDCTWSRGRSKAQMSFGKILDTISAASAPPNFQEKQLHLHQDEELEGEIFVARNVEKRGLLNIDLNVAPPEDGGSESPADENCGNGQEIRPKAVAAVASDVLEKEVSSADEHDLNFNGIAEALDEVYPGNSESRDEIQAHWSKGETNGFDAPEEEAKQMETVNTVTDSEEEREEKERRNSRWNAVLEVAENALREYEENLRNKEEKVQNRKSGTSREVELSGELHKGSNRKKITGHRRQSFAEELNDDSEVAAAAEFLTPPVVVRSTRGRALAMPNKYRDSVLDAVAEAELPRHNKSGKSAAVVSTKRKSR
ncbi:hypothetical protein Pfo_007339 [Paulownia fortunei]|nr:hypothetical protein Pfo_007339 [Paulownia fortunei]